MRKEVVIIVLLTLIILPFVSASEVAYVHASVWGMDNKIVDVFSDLGLDVDYVRCSDVSSTDFSEYELIFVGNEWFVCASEIPISEHASVVMNGRNTEEFGLVGHERISRIASSSPLKVSVDDEIIQVYTRAKYSRRSISMYYLSGYDGNGFDKVAGVYIGGNLNLGAAVAHVNGGTELTNGETASENVCFFGIHQTGFWTDKTEDLFKECVEFAMSDTGGSVCGNGVKETGEDCDDGNLINGDGCSSICEVEGSVCGNGVVEIGEECDDGNLLSGDGCSSSCEVEVGSVSIKINEFVSDPNGIGDEWIELYNPTGESVELTGWTIEDGTGSPKDLTGFSVSTLGYLVLEKNNGDFTFGLNNPGDIIILKNGATEIDKVAYGNYDDGDTGDNAPKGVYGQSVGRSPNGADTDIDNVDFSVFDVTTKGFVN